MNWSELYKNRYEIHKIWPKIWDLPISRKRFDVIKHFLSAKASVLDIGADTRYWEEKLKTRYPDLTYRSMDINRDQKHDWYHLNEIDQTFDVVLFFEVIEHLPLEEGLSTLTQIHQLLNPQGVLILTTPNIFCPPNYLRDITHCQPWAYDELGGALLSHGFHSINMWRLFNSTLLDRLTRKFIGQLLHRYIGIDFSRTIMVSAQKI